ncbi:CURVATURE THYLAKOID 1C, chloroplastic [Olea europaea subsp. europaea]|nr:CURVATURE THYLAKOID 1C, chloroplastic [Olea europaea subsp. europaea]
MITVAAIANTVVLPRSIAPSPHKPHQHHYPRHTEKPEASMLRDPTPHSHPTFPTSQHPRSTEKALQQSRRHENHCKRHRATTLTAAHLHIVAMTREDVPGLLQTAHAFLQWRRSDIETSANLHRVAATMAMSPSRENLQWLFMIERRENNWGSLERDGGEGREKMASIMAKLPPPPPVVVDGRKLQCGIVKLSLPAIGERQGRLAVIVKATGEGSESSTSLSVVKNVQNLWDKSEDRVALIGLGFAAVVALWASTNLITAIDKLPVLPSTLEFIGILFSTWFTYRYLLFKPDR